MGVACVLAPALVGALLPVAANSADGPTIEATTGNAAYVWNPSTASISPGGAVNFKSPSGVEHGVSWTSGPEKPACTGVPVNETKTNWSGSCTFASAGAYAFVCPLHSEMKGTITVGSGETNPNQPPPGTPGSPLAGTASQALKVARSQRGRSVRGSINLSQAGNGARLKVELLAARAALLGPGHAGSTRVGKLVRPSLHAGRTAFAVALTRPARQALEERDRLSLKVRVTIAPPGAQTLTINRPVAVHG